MQICQGGFLVAFVLFCFCVSVALPHLVPMLSIANDGENAVRLLQVAALIEGGSLGRGPSSNRLPCALPTRYSFEQLHCFANVAVVVLLLTCFV